jgi:hypothetical protein
MHEAVPWHLHCEERKKISIQAGLFCCSCRAAQSKPSQRLSFWQENLKIATTVFNLLPKKCLMVLTSN